MTAADDHSRELLAELQRQFQLFEDSRAKTEHITAKATARDRSVSVEANAAGHIVAVEIRTRSLDRPALEAAIIACANQALHAAQQAADQQMTDFYDVQTAVVDNIADRHGIDLTDAVHRETHAPTIPDHLLSDDAFRSSRE